MYVTRQQVIAKIPAQVLNDALDDNGDGKEDAGAFDNVVAVASQEVDGYLGGLFTVPFATPPAKVREATLAFVLEMLYQRRNIEEDKNPHAKTAKYYRDHLQKVGNRELPFDAATDKEFEPGAVIITTSPLNATGL